MSKGKKSGHKAATSKAIYHEARLRALEADTEFFLSHPHRRYRIRPAIQNEMPGLGPTENAWAFVAVRWLPDKQIGWRFSFTFPDLVQDDETIAHDAWQALMMERPRS